MAVHIITGRRFDFDRIAADAAKGEGPRHAMGLLADALDARLHDPDDCMPSLADKVSSKLLGSAPAWALAREIVGREIRDGDLVYCTGEDVGFPMACLVARRKIDAKVATFVHNLDRPRSRVGLKVFGIGRKVDLFFACSRHQTEFLARHLGVPQDRLDLVWDITDFEFYNPGPRKRTSDRPLIISVGLEQRDYRTLAAATGDLEVDVRITGFSRDAKSHQRTFPDVLPDNMRQDFYEWADLLQLYRDADLVVVSTLPVTYAAGVQSLMEGMACRRPVIATMTDGLRDYVKDPETVLAVPPGDVAAMRKAILSLLKDREAAEQQAERGFEQARARFGTDSFVTAMANRLRNLAKAQ